MLFRLRRLALFLRGSSFPLLTDLDNLVKGELPCRLSQRLLSLPECSTLAFPGRAAALFPAHTPNALCSAPCR